jgi:hypothetical protein
MAWPVASLVLGAGKIAQSPRWRAPIARCAAMAVMPAKAA